MTPTETRAALVEAMARASFAADSWHSPWEAQKPDLHGTYRALASAALSALTATLPSLGLALVPAVATQAMLQAASKADDASNVHNYGANASAEDHWDVMLAAAAAARREEAERELAAAMQRGRQRWDAECRA